MVTMVTNQWLSKTSIIYICIHPFTNRFSFNFKYFCICNKVMLKLSHPPWRLKCQTKSYLQKYRSGVQKIILIFCRNFTDGVLGGVHSVLPRSTSKQYKDKSQMEKDELIDFIAGRLSDIGDTYMMISPDAPTGKQGNFFELTLHIKKSALKLLCNASAMALRRFRLVTASFSDGNR